MKLFKLIKNSIVFLNICNTTWSALETASFVSTEFDGFDPTFISKRKKRRYELLLSSIKEHNQQIDIISKAVSSFSGAKILSDILLWSKERLASEYGEANRLLGSLKPVSKEQKTFKKEYKRIFDFYDLIVDQKKCFEKIKETLLLESDYFYDYFERNEIVNEVQSLSEGEEVVGKPSFYPISEVAGSAKERVDKNNADFVELNKKSKILDDVLGKSLDESQREAVVSDELSTLVIAAAGSGKTLTICGKVKWLLSRGVDPSKILLLAFGNDAASQMKEKMASINKNVRSSTFHSLGLNVIKDATGEKPLVEEQQAAIMDRFFSEELQKDDALAKKVLKYFSVYSYLEEEETLPKEERMAVLKAENYTTIKDQIALKKQLITYKNEVVKSAQELAIANFYYLNGIAYEYEKPFKVHTANMEHRQYTPDFYLKDYDIYHEHYGVDEFCRTPQYSKEEEAKYLAGMEWKRDIHSVYETKYFETYSYEFRDGDFEEKLLNKLGEFGVVPNPSSETQISDILKTIADGQAFQSFVSLMKTFISLYKSRYRDANEFDALRRKSGDSKKAVLFLDIAESLYKYYKDSLANSGKIDFDDMILRSSELVGGLEGYKYDYVIVDEFQDISDSRMKFLKNIVEHGHSKVFVVGDDWQSIYRFTGCDLSFFLDFEEYFPNHEVHFLNATYRNSQELQDSLNHFITANPRQIKKAVKCNKHLANPLLYLEYLDDPVAALACALRDISRKKKDASVLLLGRNNCDIQKFLKPSILEPRKDGSFVSMICPDLKIRFLTVHRSKGLEDDYCVLLNVENAKLGFPNRIEDDKILKLVMPRAEKTEFAEERRLFYVALTRTKNEAYLLVRASSPSPFFKEMEKYCSRLYCEEGVDEKESAPICPLCKCGNLVLRHSSFNHTQFFGCSNHPYCKYTIDDFRAVSRNKRCPRCGDFLIFRKGKFGAFYGCHSYPRCDYTEEIDSR